MGDNFQGRKRISLQPNDSAVPYTFTINVCSSTTANDGFIPYGTVVSSVSVKAYNASGTDITDTMIEGTPTVSNNVVTVNLNYPGATGEYKLTFILTLDSGAVIEADFTRIDAEDI